jgi:4-hydroxybenzoate polyprenyltransferase
MIAPPNKLRSVLEHLIDEKKSSLSLLQLVISLTAVIIIRTIFEEIIEQGGNQHFSRDFYRAILFYLHYYIAWVVLFGTAAFILQSILRISPRESGNIVLWSSLIIIVVPLIDLVATKGQGGKIYYSLDIHRYGYDFINFLNPLVSIQGVSTGVRCEVGIVALLSYFLATFYYKRSNVIGVALAVSLYTMISFFGYLPSLHTLFLEDLTHNSLTHNSVTGLIPEHTGVFYYLLPFMFLVVINYLRSSAQHKKTIREFLHLERLFPYMTLFAFGFFYAAQTTGRLAAIFNTGDLYKFGYGLIALILLFIHAKITNDLHDLKGDAISNPDRAIVSNRLEKTFAYELQIVTAFASLIFSVVSERTFWIYALGILALSWIYSVPPLRLKRFYPISTIVLSLIGLSVFQAGCSLIISNDLRSSVPNPYLLFLIWISYLALAHLKDYKDSEGDQQAGVLTLFTLIKSPKILVYTMLTIFSISMAFIAIELNVTSCLTIAASSALILGAPLVFKLVPEKRKVDTLLFILAQGLMFVVALLWLMTNL